MRQTNGIMISCPFQIENIKKTGNVDKSENGETHDTMRCSSGAMEKKIEKG